MAISVITASFIKVFSPRGFTIRGVILARERTRTVTLYVSAYTSDTTSVGENGNSYRRDKTYSKIAIKAMRIIIATGMLTLNRRNSLCEALHCIYVSLVYLPYSALYIALYGKLTLYLACIFGIGILLLTLWSFC